MPYPSLHAFAGPKTWDASYCHPAHELAEWERIENPENSPGEDSRLVNFESMSSTFATNMGEPWRERYYSNDVVLQYEGRASPGIVGPIHIHPGQSVSVEFATVPENIFRDEDGYYTIKFSTVNLNLEGEGAAFIIHSGCFNYDVREFFGVSETGPDCVYYGTDRFGDTIQKDRAYRRGLDRYTLGEPIMMFEGHKSSQVE